MQRNVERILLDHFGTLAARKLDSIKRHEVATLVAAKFKETPETAKKMLVQAKAMMRFAAATGLIASNPLDLLDGSALFGSYRSMPKDRVLSDDEIREVFADASKSGYLLWFCLLTGTRANEALQFSRTQMEQREQGWFWHVPREKTKSGKLRDDRYIPLSPQALAIIEGEPRFPPKLSYSGVYQWTTKHYTFEPHDCRRTFATRLGELGAPPDLIDRMLGHSQSKLRRTYHLQDWRPQGMLWAERLGAKLDEIATKEVTDR